MARALMAAAAPKLPVRLFPLTTTTASQKTTSRQLRIAFALRLAHFWNEALWAVRS